MIRMNKFKTNDEKAKKILEHHVNDIVLTLMEKEITEYCANYMKPIQSVAESDTFGLLIRKYFKNIKGFESFSNRDISKLFIEAYCILLLKEYVMPTELAKQMLFSFLVDKQREARTVKNKMHYSSSLIDEADVIQMLDTGTEIVFYGKKIYPPTNRKYLYDVIVKENEGISMSAALKKIASYERVSNVFCLFVNGTGWSRCIGKMERPTKFPYYKEDWYLIGSGVRN